MLAQANLSREANFTEMQNALLEAEKALALRIFNFMSDSPDTVNRIYTILNEIKSLKDSLVEKQNGSSEDELYSLFENPHDGDLLFKG